MQWVNALQPFSGITDVSVPDTLDALQVALGDPSADAVLLVTDVLQCFYCTDVHCTKVLLFYCSVFVLLKCFYCIEVLSLYCGASSVRQCFYCTVVLVLHNTRRSPTVAFV